MRRWHNDEALMQRRWREEIRKHEQSARWSGGRLVGDECHCLLGKGFMRKRRPYDQCASKNCKLCRHRRYEERLERRRERYGKREQIAEQLH